MGAMRQYPPTLPGTTSPFYEDTVKGTVILIVPFIMNKIVSVYEVGGLSLKIKDAETDIPLGTVSSTTWTQEISDPIVYFDLGYTNQVGSVASKLEVGKFYKIQIAYIDLNGNISFYSTLSIVKFTAKPTVAIVNYSRYRTNTDAVQYTGIYSNMADTTEKAYQYKFTLRDADGNILDDSGWKTHNSNNDTEQGQSLDQYDVLYSIQPDQKYTMQYSVLTNNNLLCNSPKYQLVGTTSIAPELSADLYVEADYENGCAKLWLEANSVRTFNRMTGEQTAPLLNGSFVLSRSSEAENYVVWTKLYTFYLTGLLPDEPIFYDYTVEQGQTYRYALQQYNDNGIYSSKIYASEVIRNEDDELVKTENTDILTNFEDMFLYDGERQLKIRFNPKVSSFKTVLQDSKKTTLGSKYPFFFRSGLTEYKEFPIAGLISYMIDENEYFLSRTEDLKMPIDWQDTTDITDDNLNYERKFKLSVLDWLNDGNIKLFRSPSEGNYLVRLMNVQLTPNDTVSRMIHSFNCQATEVDDCTPANLSLYGFLHADVSVPKQLRFGTILFSEYIEKCLQEVGYYSISQGTNLSTEELQQKKASLKQQALDYVKNMDLLGGFACQYIKFEDCWPQTEFNLGGEDYYIGSTGQYEASFTDNPRGLYLTNPTINMQGSVTYGVLTTISNTFDTVSEMWQQDIIDFPEQSGKNYIEEHNNIKERINRLYFANFYLNDLVYEVDSIEHLIQQYGMYMDSEHEEQYHDDIEYDANTGPEVIYYDTHGEPQLHYKVFLEGKIDGATARSLTNSGIPVYQYLDQYYHLEYDEKTDSYEYKYLYRGAQDLFIDGTIFRTGKYDKQSINAEEYWAKGGDIYKYTIHSLGGHYGIYATFDKIGVENDTIGATKVYIDNEVIDIALTGGVSFPVTSDIPKVMYWGSQVKAAIGYQKLFITYGVEKDNLPENASYNDSLASAAEKLDRAHKYYDASILQLERHSVTSQYRRLIQDIYNNTDIAYFIWENGRFYHLSDEERLSFTGDEIWTCFTQWTYDPTLTYELGGETYQGYCVRDPQKRNTQDYSQASYYINLNNSYLKRVENAIAAKEQELILTND